MVVRAGHRWRYTGTGVGGADDRTDRGVPAAVLIGAATAGVRRDDDAAASGSPSSRRAVTWARLRLVRDGDGRGLGGLPGVGVVVLAVSLGVPGAWGAVWARVPRWVFGSLPG